jgi:hypothetical protein
VATSSDLGIAQRRAMRASRVLSRTKTSADTMPGEMGGEPTQLDVDIDPSANRSVPPVSAFDDGSGLSTPLKSRRIQLRKRGAAAAKAAESGDEESVSKVQVGRRTLHSGGGAGGGGDGDEDESSAAASVDTLAIGLRLSRRIRERNPGSATRKTKTDETDEKVQDI